MRRNPDIDGELTTNHKTGVRDSISAWHKGAKSRSSGESRTLLIMSGKDVGIGCYVDFRGSSITVRFPGHDEKSIRASSVTAAVDYVWGYLRNAAGHPNTFDPRRPNPSSYAGDPYWTRARFKGVCCKCNGVVRKGDPIYYYPKGKRVYCDGASCGKAANADFRSMVDDEDMYNRRGNPRPPKRSFDSAKSLWRFINAVIDRLGERKLSDATAPMKDGGFFSVRSKYAKEFSRALYNGGVSFTTKRGGNDVTFFLDKTQIKKKRRNPGSVCVMKGCRDHVVPGEKKCSDHMTEYDEDVRFHRLQAERKVRAAEQAARPWARSNPSLGMPGMPHTWVTASGEKVKAGDTIEYIYKSGPSAPVVRRKKVIKYLVFDDHVMVQSGNNGDYVDDRNFIRVVRRA